MDPMKAVCEEGPLGRYFAFCSGTSIEIVISRRPFISVAARVWPCGCSKRKVWKYLGSLCSAFTWYFIEYGINKIYWKSRVVMMPVFVFTRSCRYDNLRCRQWLQRNITTLSFQYRISELCAVSTLLPLVCFLLADFTHILQHYYMGTASQCLFK